MKNEYGGAAKRSCKDHNFLRTIFVAGSAVDSCKNFKLCRFRWLNLYTFNLMEINIWPIGSLIHNLPALYAYLNIQ